MRGPVRRGSNGGLSISVGEDDSTTTDWGGGTHYGVFVEHGTRPHEIALFFHTRAGATISKSNQHPA